MISASGCCLKPIGVDWSITGKKIDVCRGCGREVVESVLVHGCCGLEICECEAVSA